VTAETAPSRRYAVVVPAFEPDAELLPLVKAVADARPLAVVVVDDGSAAASAVHFKGLEGLEGVSVLRHEVNRGKGEAIKTGLRHVLERIPDAIGAVTMDADGQHTPEDVLKVGALLLRKQEALILGERDFRGDVPLRSRVGNALTKAIFNLATGMNLSDTQTGLRGIPRGLFGAILGIRSSRYEFETDMLFLCRERGVPVVGVGIKTVYVGRNRSSHFRPLRDSARVYSRLLGNFARLARRRTAPPGAHFL
jgi:glycosyltransferase involved in cell wall biosynthesis